VILVVANSVEQSYDRSEGKKIDWLGLVLVVASIGCFTYGIDKAADWGWTSPGTIGLAAVGIIGGIVFILWEARAHPALVDLALFKIREFSVMMTAGAVGNTAGVVVIFVSMIYLQTVEGFSPIQAGVAFLAFSLGVTISSQIAGRLERFRSWKVMTISLLLVGIGSVGMGLLVSFVAWFLVVSLFTGAGAGMSWAYASVVTQSVVPANKAGAASGVVLTVIIGLGGVGTAVAASLMGTGVGQQNAAGEVIGGVLIVFGALAVICAPFVIWLGRDKSPPGGVEPVTLNISGEQ
jgi:predicted MFS family arabinose efflux permease